MYVNGDIPLMCLTREGGNTTGSVMMPVNSQSVETVRTFRQLLGVLGHVFGGLKEIKARRQALGMLPCAASKEIPVTFMGTLGEHEWTTMLNGRVFLNSALANEHTATGYYSC